jgi:D-hexose-6-phosphate mutarotase
MVKKTGCLWILLLLCHTVSGQEKVEQLFNEFAKIKDVERVKVGGIGLKLASFATETMGVESVDVLSFSRCADEMKELFIQKVKGLQDDDFETFVNIAENGKRTKVLLRIRDDIIRELVVLSTGAAPVMVCIKGKIKPSDIERVIEEHHR